jgi:zinc protease
MFYKKFFLFSLTLLFTFSFLYSQYNPKDVIPLDPSIKTGKLPNGLTYFIKQNAKPEKRAELRLVVNAGSICEDDDQKGLAHFCEHMAFNGTESFPKNELVDFVELIGMQFGADLNAYTGFDQTVYMLQVPTDKEGLLAKGLNVLEEWGHKVSYKDEDIDKERGVILEEWRLGKGAEDRIWKKELPIRFYNSKYAQRDVIGDTAIILNAPYSAFKRFYKEWYRPNNMAVIAVGDFNVDEVEKLIIEKFSKLSNPEKYRQRIVENVPDNPSILTSVLSDKELTYPQISVIYKHPYLDKDTYEDLKRGITDRLISSIFQERISEYKNKPNPPFLFAYCDYSDYVGNKDAFQVAAYANITDVMNSYKVLLTELFKAKQSGFIESEFSRAKDELIRQLEKAVAEKDKTESRQHADMLIYHFLNHYSVVAPEEELRLTKLYLDKITLNDINQRLPKLVKDDNAIILLEIPEKEGVKIPTNDDVLAIYKEYSTKQYEAAKDNTPTKPLFSKTLTPGKIVSTKENPKLNYTELKLSNGATVILKNTDFKNDEVLFRAFSPGGLSLLTSDDNVANAKMANEILDRSGLDEFDKSQLNKLLTGKIANVYSYISFLEEGLNGNSSTKDLETLFQLINLKFTAPRFDSEAFQAALDDYKNSIEQMKNSPERVFSDSVYSILYNYNKKILPLRVEDLKKVDHKKAFEYYKERFKDAGDFTFIFVGSFDTKEMKNLIEKYIASLPTNQIKEKWVDTKTRRKREPLEKTVNKGIEYKSYVELTSTGDFDYNANNLLALKALNEVINMRLREVIREEKGGTYGAYASLQSVKYPQPEYYFAVFWGCSPDRVNELTSDVIALLKELKEKPVEDKYIQKVHELLKRENETDIKTNRFWISTFRNAYFYNEDFSYLLDYNNMVDKIDANSIKDAANKYISEDKLQKFYLFPESKKD